jgi:hypothetical protein
MSYPKDRPKPASDIEKPHETVADSFSDRPDGEPLTVRLGDLWNDLYRAAHERQHPEVSPHGSAVPLLDDMKGIRQWD